MRENMAKMMVVCTGEPGARFDRDYWTM